MSFEKVMDFKDDTPEELRKVLRKCFHAMNPIRIQLGNVKTGRCWLEESDVVGRIGRSVGAGPSPVKVPLMIEPLLAFDGAVSDDAVGYADGGGAMLDDCILRVVDCLTGQELYRHPKYQCPIVTVRSNDDMETFNAGYLWKVDREELTEVPSTQGRFSTYEEACEYVAFVQGIKTHRAFRTKEAWLNELKEQDDAD